MDINKKLNEVQGFITEKRNDRDKKIAMMESLTEKAKAEKEDAERNAKTAFEATDIEGYHAAQKQIRVASDEVAMYSAKIQELKTAPLMTKEAYEQIASDIITALDELNTSKSCEFAKIINDQFIPTAEAFSKTVNRANDYLDILVFEFLKLTEGTSILANTRKVYRDFSLSNLVLRMKDSEVYTRGNADE